MEKKVKFVYGGPDPDCKATKDSKFKVETASSNSRWLDAIKNCSNEDFEPAFYYCCESNEKDKNNGKKESCKETQGKEKD